VGEEQDLGDLALPVLLSASLLWVSESDSSGDDSNPPPFFRLPLFDLMICDSCLVLLSMYVQICNAAACVNPSPLAAENPPFVPLSFLTADAASAFLGFSGQLVSCTQRTKSKEADRRTGKARFSYITVPFFWKK